MLCWFVAASMNAGGLWQEYRTNRPKREYGVLVQVSAVQIYPGNSSGLRKNSGSNCLMT
jgi:hypothetical protein